MVDPFYQNWRRAVLSRTDSVKQSVPEQYGDYLYYSKQISNPGEASYFGFFRQNIKTQAREKVLDMKDFKEIKNPSEVFLDKIKISDNHNKLCFNVDLNNNEKLSLGILNIKTGKPIDWIENWCQAEFDKDGTHVYYVQADELNRPFQIAKRKIGYPTKDVVLYTDDDPTHYLDIGISKDRQYLVFTCGHGSVRVINRDSITDEIITIAESTPGTRVFADHIRVRFCLNLIPNFPLILELLHFDHKLRLKSIQNC